MGHATFVVTATLAPLAPHGHDKETPWASPQGKVPPCGRVDAMMGLAVVRLLFLSWPLASMTSVLQDMLGEARGPSAIVSLPRPAL